METIFIDEIKGHRRTIGATNSDDEYLLWQVDSSSSDSIYFEFDQQLNGGYDTIVECTLDMDGCHIVLVSEKCVHFYWQPVRHKGLTSFVKALRSLYLKHPSILEIHDF